MESDLIVLQDPEDALNTEQQDKITEENRNERKSVSYVQEIKKSEISVKHDATITLPKPAVMELASQHVAPAPTISISSGPSVTMNIPSGQPVTMDLQSDPAASPDTPNKPSESKIFEQQSDASDIDNKPTVDVQDDQSITLDNPSETNDFRSEQQSNSSDNPNKPDVAMEVQAHQSVMIDIPKDQLVAMDLQNNKSVTSDINCNPPATSGISSITPVPEDVQNEEHKNYNNVIVQKYPEPRLENDLLVIGTLDPGFCGLLGVIPVDSTNVWVYNCVESVLINTENGKEVTYLVPENPIINLHLIPDNILIAEDDVGRSLYKLHKDTEEEMFQKASPTSTAKTIREIMDDKTLHVKGYAFSRSGQYFICIFTSRRSCLCFPKDTQYIQKYTINGELLVSKRLMAGSRKMIYTHIAKMVLNLNEDVCIAGYENYGLTVTIAVFNKDFKHRFSVRKPEPIFSMTVDPWNNIIFSRMGSIDIFKGNGRFLTSLNTDFGDNGKGKRISIDDKGEYAWLCTETAEFETKRIVIIAYSASLDRLSLPHSFREIC